MSKWLQKTFTCVLGEALFSNRNIMFTRKRYNLVITVDESDEPSYSDSMESMNEDLGIKMKPMKPNYLKLIQAGRLTEIKDLKRLSVRRAVQKAVTIYLLARLMTAKPVRIKVMGPVLRWLRKHRLKVPLRLKARNLNHIFSRSKKILLLKRLLRSRSIRLITTVRTPSALWKLSPLNFRRFWRLPLPLSVTKPRTKTQVLRGLTFALFKRLTRQSATFLCQLLDRLEANRDLAIEWAKKVKQPEILAHLRLVDIPI